jgi:alcohol dehydrogenase
MLGAAHSAANPLTALFGIVHGNAVGLLLPHVVEFNREDKEAAHIYASLAAGAGLASNRDNVATGVAALIQFLNDAIRRAELPGVLSSFGVKSSDIPTLAEEASLQWTATFNPRAITAADFSELYRRALS